MGQKYGPKLFDQTMEFNGVQIMLIHRKRNSLHQWFPASASEVIFDLEGDRISSLIDSTMVEAKEVLF
jgi:hypothetical protein